MCGPQSRHMHSLYASAQSVCLQVLRENSVPKSQPLLMVLELFNRKPSVIWHGGESCPDNSAFMLAPCHSYLLTPSAPLGADRLMGSYCSTSESEEGKLWPFPCSLASLFHFYRLVLLNSLCYCNSSLVFTISLYPHALSYFDFTDLPTFLAHSSPAFVL